MSLVQYEGNVSTSSNESYPLLQSQGEELSPINYANEYSRSDYSRMLAKIILITPFTAAARLILCTAKIITWDLGKAAVNSILGYSEAAATLENRYLNTCRAVRNLFIDVPLNAYSVFNYLRLDKPAYLDDFKINKVDSFLSVNPSIAIHQFNSKKFGYKTVNVIKPIGIKEFAAESDGELNTVMASHFLKPNVLAINFGVPNVASFITIDNGKSGVQTLKVDAKSLKRAKMDFHSTNGKIQSGVFFVPTNLPAKALEKFQKEAKELEGSADITCVNTNCKVLKKVGFSIEGEEIDKTVLPTNLFELLLFRKVFYTDPDDSDAKKHIVHFAVINTTPFNLQDFYEKIDFAVIGTRLRHKRRNADKEENRIARGIASKAIIAEEKARLANMPAIQRNALNLTRRKITVSVPSYMGDLISRIWGRHIVYEVDLSDKKELIHQLFNGFKKLKAFPNQNPDFIEKVKRDYFFTPRMIGFIRRHMMGRMDTLYLNMEDLFNHLKSLDEDDRMNYVILDDKVVLANIKANGVRQERHRKAADWALSKHALLAERKEVYCSGEFWYDRKKQCFVINKNSGTYKPNDQQVEAAADLANQIFQNEIYGIRFEVIEE